MGLFLGCAEEVSITAPFMTTEDSQPVYENSPERLKIKSDRSHLLEGRGSLIEPEEDLPRPKANAKKGKTRGRGESLQYWDGSRWMPAVYHHSIRSFLIERASQKGEYTYPRERGPGRDDVTSFLESQKDWGPERDKNWPDILYVFQKSRNHKDPAYHLKTWKFNGKIVLSAYDNRPIRVFRDLPDTLSSALSGRDMVAMKRTDPRIQQRDLIARMPVRHTTPAGTRRFLQSASSIGMRMTRFRQQHGLLSWIGRDGSQTIRDALWARLPLANKLANSIRGLEPPTMAEQQEIKKGNAGKFLNRAGRRALTSEERAKRKEIAERRLKHRRERELGITHVRDPDKKKEGRRAADELGVSRLVQPNAEEFKQSARQGVPLQDGRAGWRPTSNLSVDGFADFNAEPRGDYPQHGRPSKNIAGEPYEERARKQNELKRRLRERQEVSLRGGISDDVTRTTRPVNSLSADGLAEPDTEQIGHNTRPDRPDNRSRQLCEEQARGHEMMDSRKRKLQDVQGLEKGISGDISRGRRPAKILKTGTLTEPTAEQSQDQAGLCRPNNRFTQCPQTNNDNNNLAKLGKDRHQPEQGYNQVGNPSEGGEKETDYSGKILFGSDLPEPPPGFDLEAFINDFHGSQLKYWTNSTNPIPPEGCDIEELLKGLIPPIANNNEEDSSPSVHQKGSNEPNPDDEGWTFDCNGLPGSFSQAEGSTDERTSSFPNNDNNNNNNGNSTNYPSPTDYGNINLNGPLDGVSSEQPYYNQVAR